MIEPPAVDVAPDNVALSNTGGGLGRLTVEGEAAVVIDVADVQALTFWVTVVLAPLASVTFRTTVNTPLVA